MSPKRLGGGSAEIKFNLITLQELQKTSLSKVLETHKEAFSTNCIVRMSLDILEGLSYINWVRIRHRDLSLGNILISGDGILKVSDFGTGRIFEGSNPETSISIQGTFSIQAPECGVEYRKKLVSCDIWSFGIILSKILCSADIDLQDTLEFQVVDEDDKLWFNNFIETYVCTNTHRNKIVNLRKTALGKAPPDQLYFLPIIRECLHYNPHKRISFLRLIAKFTEFGSEKDLFVTREEIKASFAHL
jgi:serine/threonine protein kinase